ncbi:phosphoribosylformylglycinamidine synthase subunit PurQ [Neolewinella aurantiaca]|uniref:Phosphoribosylformylglycinamidine synthase subunit PurQ n=1 Tax=Neolewinella aurantiaca TaxID=2602767 RepID=A0A5C7FPF3_9BACT|nr:phosphoribosylformylglycinamidine synthase subunit PurQ [Neolewinella aurantiaca]TXF89578.1 phosphoribosylformylglycinamidine synthase subunit PurQ [Neolewinella aurantiaca]
MKFGVILFPGSNCDDDMVHVLGTVMGRETVKLWHKDKDALKDFTTGDCVIVPGGFSYGDYVRAGAVARFSPIMESVIDFAKRGGYVFGICNGFQILCEAHLLPGALLRNRDQKFIAKNCYLRTETANSAVTSALEVGQVLNIPIAHAEGRFYASDDVIADLIANDQVLFRYSDGSGEVTPEANINGSTQNIAGICNAERNVFGMMPHPERASESTIGNTDGRAIFAGMIKAIESAAVTA